MHGILNRRIDADTAGTVNIIAQLYVIVAWLHLMETYIWVNIGADNGLLSVGTKPVPEPRLTFYQYRPMSLTCEHLHEKYSLI